MSEQDDQLRELVAEVAAAYFSNSHVTPNDIPNVVGQIASSLLAVHVASAAPAEDAAEPPPAKKMSRAQIAKSITPNALISFEDGKPYKTLRRHLAVRSMTPEQYRQKWALPNDYPMVAPNYSEQRRVLAQNIGLGRKAAQPAPSEDAAASKPKRAKAKPRAAAEGEAPKRRGRRPASAEA